MTKNRIPRRNLTERRGVLVRLAQDSAYRSYHENLHYSLSLRVKQRLAEPESVTV